MSDIIDVILEKYSKMSVITFLSGYALGILTGIALMFVLVLSLPLGVISFANSIWYLIFLIVGLIFVIYDAIFITSCERKLSALLCEYRSTKMQNNASNRKAEEKEENTENFEKIEESTENKDKLENEKVIVSENIEKCDDANDNNVKTDEKTEDNVDEKK